MLACKLKAGDKFRFTNEEAQLVREVRLVEEAANNQISIVCTFCGYSYKVSRNEPVELTQDEPDNLYAKKG